MSWARRARLRRVLLLLGLSVAGSATIANARPVQDPKPPTVLFMCPHGAAKSVLASAYFQHAASERGLNVRVISAGTDPDAQVAPVVVNHLKANGYEVPIAQPRRVNADDMAQADVVISIGCDLKGLPAPRGAVQKWDDVPAPSEDFAAADAKIKERVLQLVDELARQQKR
jgi:arsenate reductase